MFNPTETAADDYRAIEREVRAAYPTVRVERRGLTFCAIMKEQTR